MSRILTCNICRASFEDAEQLEAANVRSNVRRFRHEEFAVWRCSKCRSIHARDEVDLPRYYQDYPFHNFRLGALARLFYRNILRRLTRAGLKRSHAMLDYGCGNGLFVEYIRSRGFVSVRGFDEFSKQSADPSVLKRRYDCIVSQDVIEHVPDPRELLRTFDRLSNSDAILAIGTPNASAIDLSAPEKSIHALHQPYHRTILSKEALVAAGKELGWTLERYYPTAYANTHIPLLSARMWFRYSRTFDNTLDLAFDRIRFSPKLLSPSSAFDALFGGFLCPELDIMVIFRTP